MSDSKRRSRGQNKNHNFTPLLVGLAVLTALLAGWLLFFSGSQEPAVVHNLQPDWSLLTDAGGGDLFYEDTARGMISRRGIDVSVHQGQIDWQQVKDAGVEFAIVRLGFRGYGTGTILADENFQQNVAGAAEAGMPIGVYFYSQAISEAEAEEEANFVLEQLSGVTLSYPVVYDLEEYSEDAARTDDLTAEQATANALAFCKRIKSAGYTPMVYMNADWASRMYDLDALSENLIWYADYREEPTLSGGFAMWQYSCTGCVPGIESADVDLDLFFVPKEQN
ncbi:MAG: glycoside hydrolase family 25 protein [Oscillibacter sp.]|jgi:GH25 family lysozyme M1 (1,4-beta-N-acetylmuramidase)|nr:glycoside hydrolase family 25 protein [Oscillibacter sp.]